MKSIIRPIITVIVLLGAFIILALTNPTKDEFSDWMVSKYNTQAGGSSLEQIFVSAVGAPLVKNATVRTDYVVFSVYDTTIDNQAHRAIGILRNFVFIK